MNYTIRPFHGQHSANDDGDLEVGVAHHAADLACSDPIGLKNYLDQHDCSDLYDGAVLVTFGHRMIPLADAAILAAVMEQPERDAILAAVRKAMHRWIVQRELEA